MLTGTNLVFPLGLTNSELRKKFYMMLMQYGKMMNEHKYDRGSKTQIPQRKQNTNTTEEASG